MRALWVIGIVSLLALVIGWGLWLRTQEADKCKSLCRREGFAYGETAMQGQRCACRKCEMQCQDPVFLPLPLTEISK